MPNPNDPVDIYHINRSFGILSTPVIDRDTATIYAVNWIVDDNGNRQLKVNALSLKDGKPPAGKEQPLPYDASDFDPGSNPGAPAKLRLLWQQGGFKYSKFCPPLVVDGKLLVPTFDGEVDVYELN